MLANGDIHRLCAENEIFLNARDRFLSDLAGHVLEKEASEPASSNVCDGAITVFLDRPERRYLKVDVSLLPVAEKAYLLLLLTDITQVKEVELLKGQIIPPSPTS